MDLESFFEDTGTVIADLDEARERFRADVASEVSSNRPNLHSATCRASDRPVGRTLGGLGRSIGPDRPRFESGSLTGTAHRDLLERFRDSTSTRRDEMSRNNRVELFSIVFALYRPGPAFQTGHTLALEAFGAKVTPGGRTWRETLNRLNPGIADFATARTWEETVANIAILARQSTRLDRLNGTQAGSGCLRSDGTLLTAGHVVYSPGWLFGNPPTPATTPGWVRYNQVSDAGSLPESTIVAEGHVTGQPMPLDIAIVSQAASWKTVLVASQLAAEFGALPGLTLQETELSAAELQGRPVAVIGHPLADNQGGDPAEIPLVFGDAQLGAKRFMPGRLHPEEPLIDEGGKLLLNHDCSTLGGASGSCLIDLTTGNVLGIHVSGNSALQNRAVPAWVIFGKLVELGLV